MNLPTADQHENALIGAMLIDPGCRDEAISLVSPEDFFSDLNQNIFEAFSTVGNGDYLALIDALKKTGFIKGNGDSENVGEYLTNLINDVPTSTGFKMYAMKIREASFRREMITASAKLSEDARNLKLDVGDILDERIGELTAIRGQEKSVSDGRPGRRGLDSCVVDFAELLGMNIPEREKIFPWLPEGGLAMVYGPRGIGKTFFTNTLGTSVASGAPFIKWGVPNRPAGVLVIDGEMPLTDQRDRLTKLFVKQPIAQLKIISSEVVFSKTDKDINLAKEKQKTDILNVLDQNKGIRLVIVDNISCLFSGLRESSKDDWETVIPWLLAMRRREVAVVLVHHAGKSGNQRGTSGREDLLDTVIKLEKVHGTGNDGARFIVRFEKSRGCYGESVDPIEVDLDLDSEELWTWRPIEESTYERMLNLARDGVDSVTDMAEELGVSKGLISRLKKKARDSGTLLPGKFILVPENEM